MICGTCAGNEGGDVNSGYDLALSQSRADDVKQIICDELGINGESIKTKGLGSSGPFYVEGMGWIRTGGIGKSKCHIFIS